MLKRVNGAKQSGIDRFTLDEIEQICSVRVAPSEVREQLRRAEIEGYLRYQDYDDNKRGEERRAGYRVGSKLFDENELEY